MKFIRQEMPVELLSCGVAFAEKKEEKEVVAHYSNVSCYSSKV